MTSLQPAAILEPAYPSMQQTDGIMPSSKVCEVRVWVLFGKARVAVWYFGLDDELLKPGLLHSRVPSREFTAFFYFDTSSGEWHVVNLEQLEYDLRQVSELAVDGFQRSYMNVIRMLKIHLDGAAERSEYVAVALGAPLIRADFFVGCKYWGVILNEVAYGTGGGDLPEYLQQALVDIFQKGMEKNRKRVAAQVLLKRNFKVSGDSYETMNRKANSA